MATRLVNKYLFIAMLACNAAAPATVSQADEVVNSSVAIHQILAKENAGSQVNRSELLKEVEGEAARWHSGQVKRNGEWLAAEELQESTERESLYQQMRSKLGDDLNSQRKLARWCQQNHLPDQSRAHWNAVIDLAPNDLEARRHLGYQWIEDAWYTEDELRAAAQTSRDLAIDLKQWNGRVFGIVKELTKGDSKDKQAALRRLSQIDDPKSLASLELACTQTEDHVAKLLLDRIGQHRSRAACMSLTRIALADPHSARGTYAIRKLRDFDQTFMVPELLGLLSTPIETNVSYGFNQRGELMLDRILFRETNERRELLQLQRMVRTSADAGHVHMTELHFRHGPDITRFSRTGAADSSVQSLSDESAASSLAVDEQAHFDRELADVNRRHELNSRNVRYLLSTLSGQPAELTSKQWWDWWQNKNYRTAKVKPLVERTYQQIDRPVLAVNSYTAVVTPPMDCLVAGTLVQTSTGNRPIETLERGDLVLSQNVETGQLDLKAIIRVVPRVPSKIIVIETDSDAIRSTQGHRWWVAGKGWVMAADLAPGMNLHTSTGTVVVKEVREDAEQPTFNLVVDEYHTYFVGKDRVLSFDNIEPRPTLRRVPGLEEVAE